MDSAKLNDWMQVIGIFALVASLIFVGLQMQQDREIAKVMIYQSRSSTAAEVIASLATSPDAMAAFVKTSLGDPHQNIQKENWAAPITAQDMVLGGFAVNAVFTLSDNSYFQYQEGFLPEDHWLGVRSTVSNAIATFPFVRARVEATLERHRPAFRDELIDIIREIDEESTN